MRKFFILCALCASILPAAGYRNDTEVSNVGSFGYYWSATKAASNAAYYLYFGSSVLDPEKVYHYSYRGLSVRLVR